MHVRPLRQPSHARETKPATSVQHLNLRERLFLAPHHRPPLTGIKLVRPRPRLPARSCGRLQLDPGPRDGAKPQRRGKATSQSPPSPATASKVTG